LPAPKNKSLFKSYSISKLVESKKTVKIELKDEYEGGVHGQVSFMIKVNIPQGSTDNDVDVTMSFNPEDGILTLLPHIIFNNPVEIEYWVEGFDLKEGDEDKLDFVYMNPNGTYESLERKRLKCDVEKGGVKLYEGLTNHFSRFAGLTLH
jgi:hypothetical protein